MTFCFLVRTSGGGKSRRLLTQAPEVGPTNLHSRGGGANLSQLACQLSFFWRLVSIVFGLILTGWWAVFVK